MNGPMLVPAGEINGFTMWTSTRMAIMAKARAKAKVKLQAGARARATPVHLKDCSSTQNLVGHATFAVIITPLYTQYVEIA